MEREGKGERRGREGRDRGRRTREEGRKRERERGGYGTKIVQPWSQIITPSMHIMYVP